MNKTELRIKRKTMRKLKFYGIKDTREEEKDSRHIATVYVDENKKVIVESEDPKVKEDLLKAIYDPDAPDEPTVFIIRGGAPTEELRKQEEEERKQGKYKTWMSAQRPGDPDFLEALCDEVRSLSKKYGDYYLFYFDIVEE